MATRATIAYQDEEGTIHGIYSHWDGYISHLGVILNDFFGSLGACKYLVKGNQISSIMVDEHGVNIDRFKDDSHDEVYLDEETLINTSEEYLYYFKNGKWLVKKYNDPDFEELDIAIEKEK